MNNFVVLTASTALEVDAALKDFHRALRHRSFDDINFERITKLMTTIREENEELKRLALTKSTIWEQKACVYLTLGTLYAAALLSIIVPSWEDSVDEQEAIDCTSRYQRLNCTASPLEIEEDCHKPVAVRVVLIVTGIFVALAAGIQTLSTHMREKAEKKRSEIWLKTKTEEQAAIFHSFIEKMETFHRGRDRRQFKDCIDQMRKLRRYDDFFIPRIGSNEIIASFLLHQLQEGDELREKVKTVKKIARHHRTHGEGAMMGAAGKDLNELWNQIEYETGPMRYLQIEKNRFIDRNGVIGSTEEDMLQGNQDSERPEVDLTKESGGFNLIGLHADEDSQFASATEDLPI